RPELIVGGNEQILASVEQVRLRRVGNAANLRVPQRLAGERIVRDDVADAVEDDLARGCQHAAATACTALVLIAPGRLPRFVVERSEEAAARPGARLELSTKAHRPTRIGVEQIEDRVDVV